MKLAKKEDRLAIKIDKIRRGGHATREDGVCAMEAVAWLAGEPHSDTPECTSPVVAAFVRQWNDSMRSNTEREILRPLLPKLINTVDREGEGWVAMGYVNWLVRQQLPAWLRITPELAGYSTLLESCEWLETKGLDILSSVQNNMRNYGLVFVPRVVSEAVGASGGSAVLHAVQNVSKDASWTKREQNATRFVAEVATTAVCNAASIAASNSASKNLGLEQDVKVVLARRALEPTVKYLQQSALKLFDK